MEQFKQFDEEMMSLFSNTIKEGHVFDNLGMVGRCIYNLLLVQEISITQAQDMLNAVDLLDVRGTSQANMRQIIKRARAKINKKLDYKNYPFLPVFWMTPYEIAKVEIKKKLDLLKEAEKELEQQTSLISIGNSGDDSNDPNDNDTTYKIKPIEAMHRLAFRVDSFSKIWQESKQVELASYKVYLDVLKAILEYDDGLADEINVNELFQRFDEMTEFILEMNLKHPTINIAEEFREFLRTRNQDPEEN